MKKVISVLDFYPVCQPLSGAELRDLGFFCPIVGGVILTRERDLMLDVLKEHPEFHVASFYKYGNGVNRYDENAFSYTLCRGDNDPDLYFEGWSLKLSDAEKQLLKEAVDHMMDGYKYLSMRKKLGIKE